MKKKTLFLIPMLLLLTGCGSEIKNIVQGNVDHSPVWENNFYTNWDSGLNDVEFAKEEERELVDDDDMIFRSYYDDNFKAILGPDYSKYIYYSEYKEDSYGLNNCLSNYSDNFKRNFTSKLFDGKMFCLSRYESVRVQINESGIGINFGCHTSNSNCDYFALQFKSSLDFKQHNPYAHYADIKMKISFYSKKDNKYNKQTLVYTLDNVPTNVENYTLFGFTLANVDMNGVYGCSIEYELLRDEYNENEEEELKHCLLLYELLMPNSIWK